MMRLTWHLGMGRELGLVFWSLFCFEAAYGAQVTAWPLWIERLGAPITAIGFVMGLTGIIRPFVLVGATTLEGRVDTRKLLLGFRALSVLGMTFAAFAPGWRFLFVTAVLYAFGDFVFPVLHAHITTVSGSNPTRSFMLTCTVGPSIALMITPLLAGAVIVQFGLQGSILFSALFSLCGLLCMVGMTFKESETNLHASAPKATYTDVARQRNARDLVLLHGLVILALAIGSSLLPNFLKDARNLAPETISVLSTGAAVGAAVFGLASIRLALMRNEPFVAAIIAVTVASLGFGLFAMSGAVPIIAVAYLMRGGMNATWAFLLTCIGKYTSPRTQTRSFTLVEILGGGALSFGPILAGQLYGISPRLPLLTSSVLALVMVGIMLLRQRSGWLTEVERPPISSTDGAANASNPMSEAW